MLNVIGTRERPVRGPLAVAWLLVAAALTLVACGGSAPAPTIPGLADVASGSPAGSGSPVASAGSSASPAPTASVDPRDAMVAYAQCMRAHGVDMPDPQFSGDGGATIQIGGTDTQGTSLDPSSTAFKDASKACEPLMPKLGSGPAPSLDPAFQDRMLAYAKCMRAHGIDMPDPQFSSDGNGVSIQVSGAVDPGSGSFKDADKACGGGIGSGPGFSVGSGPVPSGAQP